MEVGVEVEVEVGEASRESEIDYEAFLAPAPGEVVQLGRLAAAAAGEYGRRAPARATLLIAFRAPGRRSIRRPESGHLMKKQLEAGRRR